MLFGFVRELLKTAIAMRKNEANGKVVIDYSLHMVVLLF
jgi:hypothetical protein